MFTVSFHGDWLEEVLSKAQSKGLDAFNTLFAIVIATDHDRLSEILSQVEVRDNINEITAGEVQVVTCIGADGSLDLPSTNDNQSQIVALRKSEFMKELNRCITDLHNRLPGVAIGTISQYKDGARIVADTFVSLHEIEKKDGDISSFFGWLSWLVWSVQTDHRGEIRYKTIRDGINGKYRSIRIHAYIASIPVIGHLFEKMSVNLNADI